MTETDTSLAPAVSRAVRILGLLEQGRGAPSSLADVARGIGAAKSSTSNILAVLEEAGLVQRRETGYVLGRRTAELGGAYLASFDQVREFYRICATSPVLSHELVQLAVLDGTDVLYLARHEGRAPLRLTAGIGDRFPAALTAVGNALLAALSPHEVTARYAGSTITAMTARSVTTLEGLQAKLALARERGWAVDEGEVYPNVVGIAMTVPARLSGEQTLAIGVSTLDSPVSAQLSLERRDQLVVALRSAVGELTNPMVSFGS